MKKHIFFAFAITLTIINIPYSSMYSMSTPASPSYTADESSSLSSPSIHRSDENSVSDEAASNSSSRSSSGSDSEDDSENEQLSEEIIGDIVGANADAVSEHILEGNLSAEGLLETILDQLQVVKGEYPNDQEKLDKEQGVYSRLLLQLMANDDDDIDLSKVADEFAKKAETAEFFIFAKLLVLIDNTEITDKMTKIQQLNTEIKQLRQEIIQYEAEQKQVKATQTSAQPGFLRRLFSSCFRTRTN